MAMPCVRLLAGLGVAGGLAAGAVAQSPSPPPGRAAVLLAPRPTPPGQGPAVARAAPGDGLAGLSPAPGTKLAKTGAAGWGWSKTEAGAAATSTPRTVPTPFAVPPASQEPSLLTKGLGKLTGTPQPAADPRGGATQPPANAAVAAGGPQVYAGPPAWRWYGYGTVTPGANGFAPAGQYPRASANWYHVTGATPGAFPVPVVNPYRSAPGGEPPAYAQMPAGYRGPGVAGPATAGPVMMPATPRVSAPEPVRVAPPATAPIRTAVGVPTLAPPPGLGAELPVVPAKPPEPLAALPTTKPAESVPAPMPSAPTVPVALPVSAPPTLPADDVRWQPGPAKPSAPPPAGEWSPVGKGK